MKQFLFLFLIVLIFGKACLADVPTLVQDIYVATSQNQLEVITPNEIQSIKGSFRKPMGLSVWRRSIFVVDQGNRRIQRLSPSGQLNYSFQDIRDKDGERVRMERPIDLVMDSSGLIYVLDGEESVIYRFDQFGEYQATLGGFGAFGVQFNTPTDLTIDSLGFLYVADTGNHRVLKIDREGKKVAEIRAFTEKLDRPHALAVSSVGDLYVADNGGIRVFNEVGNYVHTILPGGQFGPMEVDRLGRLVVVNRDEPSLDIVTVEGKLVFRYPLGFLPGGMCVSLDRIYLTDPKGNCVLEFGYE